MGATVGMYGDLQGIAGLDLIALAAPDISKVGGRWLKTTGNAKGSARPRRISGLRAGSFFQRQDEIQTLRDNLINELEQQLSQQVTVQPLFACE